MPAHLPFPQPTLRGRFLRRYKRFLCDVELPGGDVITAHTANTGAMTGLLVEGAPVLLWDSQNPKRKLRHTWLAIRLGEVWAGVDTQLPNRLAAAAIEDGDVAGFGSDAEVLREQKMGARSRVDLLVREEGRPESFVEVKNVTLVDERTARFPDAPTERGRKHLRELIDRVSEGHEAAMLYVVQRQDVDRVIPADDIDPEYGALLREAVQRGVRALALRARVDERGLHVDAALPVALG